MNNYKILSDSELLKNIRIDAGNERSSCLAVIHQLREVRRRRLDAQLGYATLHKYCIEELHYSPGSAWRRVEAMEALGEMPELEEQVAAGALTLANVSQVQHFCEKEEKTLREKKEIFEQVAGLSKRETERVLAQIAPEPERPEKVRPLDREKTELRVTLSSEALKDLDQIRDLIAHSHPGASYADVIAYLAKLGLKKLDPGAPKRSQRRNIPPGEKLPTTIPAATLRALWRRDGGKCGYICAETGKICAATALVQPDHIIPRAKGGTHDLSNLRLRCRSHNLLAAIEEFGEEKMRPYLR